MNTDRRRQNGWEYASDPPPPGGSASAELPRDRELEAEMTPVEKWAHARRRALLAARARDAAAKAQRELAGTIR